MELLFLLVLFYTRAGCSRERYFTSRMLDGVYVSINTFLHTSTMLARVKKMLDEQDARVWDWSKVYSDKYLATFSKSVLNGGVLLMASLRGVKATSFLSNPAILRFSPSINASTDFTPSRAANTLSKQVGLPPR